MPVIEYCTFFAALCLNCGAMGQAALKWPHGRGAPVRVWNQKCSGRNTSSFLRFVLNGSLQALGVLLGRGTWLSAIPRKAPTSSSLQWLLVCLSRGYLSQHQRFSSSKHSWLQDNFGTWKASEFVWTHYAVCILPALLSNWDIHAYSVVFPL